MPNAFASGQVWWCRIINEPFVVTFRTNEQGIEVVKCSLCEWEQPTNPELTKDWADKSLWPEHFYVTTVSPPHA